MGDLEFWVWGERGSSGEREEERADGKSESESERALQETIYSVTEYFRHRSLKIRHKNLSVTISDSVMY